MARKPSEVFTPRNPDVNESMYVARPEHERALLRGIEGSQHLVLHGESGSGKSWLYKRVLHAAEVDVHVANLANASRLGSIVAEIKAVVQTLAEPRKTGYKETKNAEANAYFAKGGLSHTNEFEIPAPEALEESFALFRKNAGERRVCLVLDNLETIFESEKLMSELGEIVILLDDQRYARHDVKLIVVGVPSGVREYFARTQNRTTVTNRLYELPEVAALTYEQVDRLVRTGFVVELEYACTEEEMVKLVEQIAFLTTGIPQRVHELCLELAYIGEDTRTVSLSQLPEATLAWLRGSLTSVYSAIESVMNERKTVAGRRNQVLYALGQINRDEFGYFEIEEVVRASFPESTKDKNLNISGLLSELAGRADSLIKRSPKGDRYMFVDPKYRMCLRAMLRKVDENVEKVELRQLASKTLTD